MASERTRLPDPVDRHVGTRIRERRKALSLTQAELGKVLGISEQQMRRFERGSSRLSPRQLLALSRKLEVGSGYLLEGAPTSQDAAEEDPAVVEIIESFRAIRNDVMRRDLLLLVQAAARRSFAKSGGERGA